MTVQTYRPRKEIASETVRRPGLRTRAHTPGGLKTTETVPSQPNVEGWCTVLPLKSLVKSTS